MFILGAGRRLYLEFLRNLTPQILFLSLAFVVGSKLRMPSFDLSNAGETAIFFVLLAIAGFSIWCNCSLFLSESIAALNLREGYPALDRSVGAIRLVRANARFAWSKKWSIFEVIFVFVIVEFGLVVVTIFAISDASALLKSLQT